MTLVKAFLGITRYSPLIMIFAGCARVDSVQKELSREIIIRQEAMETLHEELAGIVKAASETVMTEPGLVGALGGARVKLLKTGMQQILLPLPQLADGQVLSQPYESRLISFAIWLCPGRIKADKKSCQGNVARE